MIINRIGQLFAFVTISGYDSLILYAVMTFNDSFSAFAIIKKVDTLQHYVSISSRGSLSTPVIIKVNDSL